ncbi:MAG: flavodoxin family protein [Deltaproteobacteria bacterium]|nr:flavodoxin family protein [Deltaproteobacteria bacterium]
METYKIMGLVGSPRKQANTYILVKKALEEAATVPGAQTELYELAGKQIGHCIGCNKCAELGRCVLKDDFSELLDKYIEADGIIWGAPVYHMSIPGLMKSAIDRMANMLSAYYMNSGKDLPRYSKVCGVITVGAHRNGGQDLVLSYMTDSCLMMNNVVVSGMTLAGAYIGAAGWSGQPPDFLAKDNVVQDDWGMMSAQTVGKRVAEMTRIIAEGKAVLGEGLSSDYIYKHGPEKYAPLK